MGAMTSFGDLDIFFNQISIDSQSLEEEAMPSFGDLDLLSSNEPRQPVIGGGGP